RVSSGNKKIYRLSLRGNRRLNHAIHMAAITQIRHKHSDGRAYYDRKIAEGKTPQGSAAGPETADQRRHLPPAAGRRPQHRSGQPQGPRRATGEPLCLRGRRFTPRTPALRTSHSRATDQPTSRGSTHPGHIAIRTTREKSPATHLTTTTTKRIRSARSSGVVRGGLFAAPNW